MSKITHSVLNGMSKLTTISVNCDTCIHILLNLHHTTDSNTAQAKTHFPQFFPFYPTIFKFLDFPRFSRWVATTNCSLVNKTALLPPSLVRIFLRCRKTVMMCRDQCTLEQKCLQYQSSHEFFVANFMSLV